MMQATISEDYRALQSRMHADRPDYGLNGGQWAGAIMALREMVPFSDALDFGCGKGMLAGRLQDGGLDVQRYDPAIAEWSAPPRRADLVICTDVMEHIEPDYIDAVLDEIQALARRAVFFSVSTRPAGKIMADGRNAHLIVAPPVWWMTMFADRWATHTMNIHPFHFVYVGLAQ